MPQCQFFLKNGISRELNFFPQIFEFGLNKNTTIQLDSFPISKSGYLTIYFITDGKFDWMVKQRHHILLPGNTAVILPGQEIGGLNGYMDIGSFYWVKIRIENFNPQGGICLGNWSKLTPTEKATICKILCENDLSVIMVKCLAGIFHELRFEIENQEIGFISRVNQLIDTILIKICRESTSQSDSRRDFPKTFLKLEQKLRQSLDHQWTVEEMAAMVGLGSTAFTEKVKSYSGFSPLQYLINIRIAEATKLLKKHAFNITDIAFETGFYSSQHFSTTFKKLTGHTPGEFRKRNLQPNNLK